MTTTSTPRYALGVLGNVQRRCAEWTTRKWPETRDRDDAVLGRLAKLLEEAGELARACIGDLEGRPDRGHAPQEAAQVVLIVASLIGIFYPGYDLFADLVDELERLEDLERPTP